MNTVLTPEELEFSRGLDIRQLLQTMGFAEDAINEDDDSIRVYCPIHKDQVIRSLAISKGDNRFHCQFKSCPAHDGGELIELTALYLGVDVPAAIAQLSADDRPERQLIMRADQLIESGKMEDAKVILKEAVRLAPRDEVTRCKLAAAYLETNQRDKGFREYLIAAEDFAVKNQIEKTLSIYNILVMMSPSDVRVRRQLAFLFSRLGRYEEAAEHLKWVIDQLMTRGDLDEAIKVVVQILDMGVEQPEILMLFANLLSQTHRINEAVSTAQRAAELALAKNDLRIADQAVTFGLIYRPQDETFREMEKQLREAPVVGSFMEEIAKEDDDFGDWLGNLEEEVEGKPAKPKHNIPSPEPIMEEAPEGQSVARKQRWEGYCRQTLSGLNEDKLDSMGKHLRGMYDDVQSQFKEGLMDDWEMSIIRDFYSTFCSAYDEVRKAPQDAENAPLQEEEPPPGTCQS